MAGVVAAAIAAAVVAVGGGAAGYGGSSSSALDGGGGGGPDGVGGGGWAGADPLDRITLGQNVTDFLLDVVTEMTHAVTPAALRRGSNSSSFLLVSSSASGSSSSSSASPPNGSVAGLLLSSASNNTSVTSTLGPADTSTELLQRPDSPYDVWAQVVIALILGLLTFCTVIGNCLVCISVAIVKRLQTPSNLLIVSLAVADLLVAIFVMPLAATLQIYGVWVLSPEVCDMWTTTDVLLCTASILNLCMISVDRYFVITRPFQYAMKRTPRRMAIMITIVWVVSAVVSIPPVFGWKSPHEPFNCYISREIGYQIYATLCAFYLPLIVMIFVYVKIWLVSSKIAKAEARSQVGSFDKGEVRDNIQLGQGRASRDSDESTTLPNGALLLRPNFNGGGGGSSSGGGDGGEPELCDRLKNRRFTLRSLIPHRPLDHRHPGRINSSKERKATKTLGIIMGCFTLCWLPFFIMALVRAFCGDACVVPVWLDSILWWLGYANSFLNPVIYARFNREFRTPFKEILLFRCRGINSRMRSESYVEQYGGADPRNSLKPPVDLFVRYNSQGHTVVHVGNGSANSHSESKI